MSRGRITFYAIFFGYMAVVFVFTVLIDGHLDLFGLLKYIPWFKYLSFFGFLLIVIDFIWTLWSNKTIKKASDKLREDNKILKAKIYDQLFTEQESSETEDE